LQKSFPFIILNIINLIKNKKKGKLDMKDKEISKQLYKLNISDKEKIGLVEKVGEFEFRLNQGGNEQLQLEALLSQFALYKGN